MPVFDMTWECPGLHLMFDQEGNRGVVGAKLSIHGEAERPLPKYSSMGKTRRNAYKEFLVTLGKPKVIAKL